MTSTKLGASIIMGVLPETRQYTGKTFRTINLGVLDASSKNQKDRTIKRGGGAKEGGGGGTE